jgi:hypothetical protein
MKIFSKKVIKFLVEHKIFGYDNSEKNFINFLKKNYTKENKKFKNYILINGYQDYYSLIFAFLIKKEIFFSGCQIIIYYPLFDFCGYNYKKNFFIFSLNFYYTAIRTYVKNWRWSYLYSLISKNSFYLQRVNLFEEISYSKKAEKILLYCKNKKDLKSLKYKKTLIGDLIYDTYLRFRECPTVNLKDPYLIEVISKALQLYDSLDKISKKINIKFFLSQQASYIHHGTPFRFFQKKKTNSYHFDNRFEYLRKQNRKIKFLRRDFAKYPKIFTGLNNKKDKLNEAKKLLEDKFKGRIIEQERWMPLSVYHKKPLKINQKIVAVIFLHCFVDSPSARGDSVFVDFHDWAVETIEFFKKKNLDSSVIIKPHPGSQPGSKFFENYLRKKYNKFIWITGAASNSSIFKLKPNCGISVYGTVLHELAYHNIPAISAGTSPNVGYKFVYTAKNKNEYFDQIEKNIKKKSTKKIKKNQILQMAYCNYCLDNTKIDLIAKKMNLRNFINENSSNSLALFQKMYEKFKSNF